MTLTCPQGHPIEAGQAFCSVCGGAITSPAGSDAGRTATCPNGHPVLPEESFCGMCAAPLGGSGAAVHPPQSKRRSPWLWVGIVIVGAAAAALAITQWPTDTTPTALPEAGSTTSSTSSTSSVPPNAAPTLDPIADQGGITGDIVNLTATASDSEGDGLSFSATGLPAGAVMDPAGVITGTLVGPAGNYTPVVTVSDGTTEVSTTFSWLVTEPAPPPAAPEFAATADWIDTNGNVFPTLLADLGGVITETAALDIRFAATDPSGGAVTFNATGLPGGLTMDVDGRLSGAAAPGTARGEPYQATITASSTAGATDVSIEWQVAFGPGATCEAIATDFTYANAVAYWLREDQPVGLDVDGNGLPCVSAFIGLDRLTEIDGFYGPADFAAGLTCTDLADQSYDTVVAYWLRRGQPTDLDEGFGLPCDVSRQDDAAAFYLFEGSG